MTDIRYVNSPEAYLARRVADSPANSASRALLLGARLHVDMVTAASGWVPARTVPDASGSSRSGFVRTAHISDRQQLKIFYTDVGQGDATLIEAEGGIVIIDGGPNRGFHDVLRDRLQSLRRADEDAGLTPRARLFVNAVVVTHFDKDHYCGLTRVFEDQNFRFGTLYHNGLPRYGEGVAKDLGLGHMVLHQDGSRSMSTDLTDVDSARDMIAAGQLRSASGGDNLFARFLRAVIAASDEGRLLGMRRLYRRDTSGAPDLLPGVGPDLAFEVLGPVTTRTSGPVRLPAFPDPHKLTPSNPHPEPSESHTINGNSVVLRLRYGNRLFLFGGDLNQPAQRYLSARYGSGAPFRAHVNKACHHGSSDFDLQYLKDVAPEATVFSSGDNGSYDHPLPDAMGAAARHSSGDCPLVFSTELARDNKSSGSIMLGHINARSNGAVIVMAQKKEKAGTRNLWHTFPLPCPGPFPEH